MARSAVRFPVAEDIPRPKGMDADGVACAIRDEERGNAQDVRMHAKSILKVWASSYFSLLLQSNND
jgi:hypothetical protein